ncbi:MAG: hypothetical protein ABI551_06990 [Polyangiaceae bacterium]
MSIRPIIVARALAAFVYGSVQIALVLTAAHRPDGSFGFRMFNESSSVRARLSREIEAPSGDGTIRVPAPGGKWRARDAEGDLHRFDWYDRAKSGALVGLDSMQHASYGADTQVERLHAALGDLATHVQGDSETKALVLEIDVSHNGRPPVPVTFTALVAR